MTQQVIDPANTVSLNSIDLGHVQDPSGRVYPIWPQMPVVPIYGNDPGVVITYDPTSGIPIVAPASGPAGTMGTTAGSPGTPTANVSNPITTFGDWLASKIMPAHLGSRVVMGVLGIGILLIVAFRLVK